MNPYTVVLKSSIGCLIEHVHVRALDPVQACVVAAAKFYPEVEWEDSPIENVEIYDVIEGYVDSILPPIILKNIPKEDCPQYLGICPSLDKYIEKQLKEEL